MFSKLWYNAGFGLPSKILYCSNFSALDFSYEYYFDVVLFELWRSGFLNFIQFYVFPLVHFFQYCIVRACALVFRSYERRSMLHSSFDALSFSFEVRSLLCSSFAALVE